jgi:hypothetical protein
VIWFRLRRIEVAPWRWRSCAFSSPTQPITGQRGAWPTGSPLGLQQRGVDAEARAVADVLEVSRYEAVVLGSAIHSGKWLPRHDSSPT